METSSNCIASRIETSTSSVLKEPLNAAKEDSNDSKSNPMNDVARALHAFENTGGKTITYFHISK